MALTASALKGRMVDQGWKKNNFVRWVEQCGTDKVSRVEPLRERCSVLEKEVDALVRERDQLRKELDAAKKESNMFQQYLNDDYIAFSKELGRLQQENERLRLENESLKAASVEIPVVQEEEDYYPTVQGYGACVAEPAENAVPAVQEAKKKNKKQVKPCDTSKPRLFDANNDEDIAWIMGTCTLGVDKCKLSNSYVNKSYKQIIPNNGFHNGVNNACLAISLSDGLSRIVNGRPATKQETNDMVKALGCKGMMKDFYDPSVVVAIYNKICAPHGINVHLFERKANGRHIWDGSIAHSPDTSSSDPCIVLSWIRDTHFELMLK